MGSGVMRRSVAVTRLTGTEHGEQVVPEQQIGLGYELPTGTIVPLDDGLDSLPLATARTEDEVEASDR